jgi:ATP-dependent helicase HrpA
LGLLAQEIARLVGQTLTEWQTLQKKLPAYRAHAAAVADIEAQLKRLIHKTFIVDTPYLRLQHFPRYLKAAGLRLEKLKTDPARDARLFADYQPLWTQYERRAAAAARQNRSPYHAPHDAQLEQFRWLMEELRVGLFAQELKTPTPVSVKRLQKMWEGMR